eukprot:TRINITY_DN17099_c0_g3_i2.p1 TRINITY_DN17099_c0_g3~~TRINITY_DN17099_c0_g3_i2.p1  ORF type:complete len:341 (+),score=20.59 TRINITY_DN17099_c0_g3_i2:141-1163(+)
MGLASLSMLLLDFVVVVVIGPTTILSHRVKSKGETNDNALEEVTHQKLTTNATSVAGKNVEEHLPSKFSEFENTFHELMETDPSLQKPLKPVKHTLWMGVPVRCERVDVRITIRRSWMSQPGICRITTGSHEAEAKKSCALYTSFVVGNISNSAGLPSDCIEEQDCVPVQEEGDLSKKTVALFRKALDEFPWATHVGKIDTDTFPRFYLVLPHMRDGQYSLIGDMLVNARCGGHKFCPPNGCGQPVGGNLLQYKVKAVGGTTCWTYPSGSLYILSRDMALGAFKEETQSALPNTGGNEDLMVGWSAHEYARRKNVQVQTLTEEAQAKVTKKMWSHTPWAK